MNINDNNIAGILTEKYKDLSIKRVLEELSETYKDDIVFSTSFGYEDQVVTDIIFTNHIPVKVFTIDTGRLFNETYSTHSATLEKYSETIQVYFPDSKNVEDLLTQKGPLSFYQSIENRKECCHIRKVEPLKRALFAMKCWVTGLRAEQSEARKELKMFEWDENHHLVKYNPLYNWSFEQVKNYIREHNVPFNVLHDKGFLSIGCAPCTRALKEGENIRAGRWWWENNSKKECGLHEA